MASKVRGMSAAGNACPSMSYGSTVERASHGTTGQPECPVMHGRQRAPAILDGRNSETYNDGMASSPDTLVRA